MKIGKKYLFGMVIMAMAVGFVLAACNWGDYKADVMGRAYVVTLLPGHRYAIKVSDTVSEKGTYKKKGSTITFTRDSEYGGGSYTGTKKGKTITVNGFDFKKSVDGEDQIISAGDTLDVEFGAGFDYAEWDNDDE
ncbi:hypothetical protein AGMMS49940_05170 [Spirochaetia bacterium]|nr:hypothetical protein AGMMS49940_05170 [Spirochaetia bacterium]